MVSMINFKDANSKSESLKLFKGKSMNQCNFIFIKALRPSTICRFLLTFFIYLLYSS
jgi:hypothetical protein